MALLSSKEAKELIRKKYPNFSDTDWNNHVNLENIKASKTEKVGKSKRYSYSKAEVDKFITYWGTKGHNKKTKATVKTPTKTTKRKPGREVVEVSIPSSFLEKYQLGYLQERITQYVEKNLATILKE